jgi:hypothetical protein
MEQGDVLGMGFCAYVTAIVVAHILAWFRRGGLAALLLFASALVPLVIMIIASGSHDAHGTGLYGVDLMMMVISPVVWLVSALFGLTVWLVLRARRKEVADQ